MTVIKNLGRHTPPPTHATPTTQELPCRVDPRSSRRRVGSMASSLRHRRERPSPVEVLGCCDGCTRRAVHDPGDEVTSPPSLGTSRASGGSSSSGMMKEGREDKVWWRLGFTARSPARGRRERDKAFLLSSSSPSIIHSYCLLHHRTLLDGCRAACPPSTTALQPIVPNPSTLTAVSPQPTSC
jgi:hypothetical protein